MYVAWVTQICPAANMLLVLLLMYVVWITPIYPAAIIMHATMLMCCTNIGHTTRSTLVVDTVGEEPNLIISIML